METEATRPQTYFLVDGENLDATLGLMVLQRKPEPHERPRWERVFAFVRRTWGEPVRALFFLNAGRGFVPWGFMQALRSLGYEVVPLGIRDPGEAGNAESKVVDEAIRRTLGALEAKPGSVVLASHDGDFEEALGALGGGGRRVGLLGFRECMSASLVQIPGVEFHDLEDDVEAFDGGPLPRMRVIPLEEFDPDTLGLSAAGRAWGGAPRAYQLILDTHPSCGRRPGPLGPRAAP